MPLAIKGALVEFFGECAVPAIIIGGDRMSNQIISSFKNFCMYFDKTNPSHLEAAEVGDRWVQIHGQELLAIMSPAWYKQPAKPDKNAPVRSQNIQMLRDACKTGNLSLDQTAYLMATVEHETADTFEPIHEYGTNNYFTKMYEGREDLENFEPGDGIRYAGRGFVQITGRRNYTLFSKILDVDLVGNPDLALDTTIAAQIIVHGMVNGVFTGVKFTDYINASKCDYVNARRIINGLDRAEHIAELARLWEKWLTENPCAAEN